MKNARVLITGCSSGIGRALSVAFAEAGHRVAATARRVESLEGLTGMSCLEQLDVTDPASIDAAVQRSVDHLGGIDLLVNNAGFGLMGPAVELDLQRFRLQLETNLIAPLMMIRAVLPTMIGQGGGRVINVGSVSGITPTPFSGAYCASKAALHALDDTLRLELAPFGIHVITLQPGAVRSRFAEAASAGIEDYRNENSRYREVAQFIEARAKLSQQGASDDAGFARAVVRKATATRSPVRIRAGKGSWLLPALQRLPVWLRDRVLSRRFGLDTL